MRLWHVDMIPALPRMQLLGQHREVAALRGLGWGKKHKTVNYVFDYSPFLLYRYHINVLDEMQKRGYEPDREWLRVDYRGERCEPYPYDRISLPFNADSMFYPEHNDSYLQECLTNLKDKIDSAPEGKYSAEDKKRFFDFYKERSA